MSERQTDLTGVGDEFAWFVGIDWGTTAHQVDVGDATGRRMAERRVDHTGPALSELVDWLATLSGGRLERVAVAIEASRGAVVETLLERGAAVFTLNPKQVDRFRDRFSVAGAKDDRRDALVLRSALRTDRACFHRLVAEDARVIQVRELTRATADLTHEFVALTNRLREQVHRIAPAWLTLSANADDAWFWTLLEQAETPAGARRLRRAAITRLLQQHRIRRVTVDDVLTALHAPPVFVAPGTVEAATTHMALLVRRIRLVHVQRQECTRQLEALLEDLAQTAPPPPDRPAFVGPAAPSTETGPSDVTILRSLPGVGVGVTATLVAEAMALLAHRDYQGLRATSGVAPVRRQTGKNKRGLVGMRYACNGRLRDALYHCARVSTHVDEAARHYYAALRARGHSHGRALRSVADRWLRILIAMLKTRTVYDPARLASGPSVARG